MRKVSDHALPYEIALSLMISADFRHLIIKDRRSTHEFNDNALQGNIVP